MKQLKRLLALTLCCLILCQTTVNTIPMDDGIETHGHKDSSKED
mgnify:CR=1 FL=1